jgi:hypothetical protein
MVQNPAVQPLEAPDYDNLEEWLSVDILTGLKPR